MCVCVCFQWASATLFHEVVRAEKRRKIGCQEASKKRGNASCSSKSGVLSSTHSKRLFPSRILVLLSYDSISYVIVFQMELVNVRNASIDPLARLISAFDSKESLLLILSLFFVNYVSAMWNVIKQL